MLTAKEAYDSISSLRYERQQQILSYHLINHHRILFGFVKSKLLFILYFFFWLKCVKQDPASTKCQQDSGGNGVETMLPLDHNESTHKWVWWVRMVEGWLDKMPLKQGLSFMRCNYDSKILFPPKLLICQKNNLT